MGDRPAFTPESAPSDPFVLFDQWLAAATDPMARAMVLSTVDELGHPDARVVMLREVTGTGWCFSTSSLSPKGSHLADIPFGALTWYWQAQGRQIRARGPVRAMPGTTDFLARPRASRAEVVVGARQSQPLTSLAELRAALAAAPTDEAPLDWTTYELRPTEVQFFQLEPDRAHIRVRYDRDDTDDDGWTRTLRWP